MTTLMETESAAPPTETPTPPASAADRKRFDAMCSEYNFRKAMADEAAEKLREAKAELLTWVETFGFIPTNAEKSKRFEGNDFVATRTVSVSTDVDDQAVVKLQLALSKAKYPRLFPKLFSTQVSYALQKGSREALAAAGLPPKIRNRIRDLYSRCTFAEPNTPSLKVELLTAVAAKAAKSAAKKGGK